MQTLRREVAPRPKNRRLGREFSCGSNSEVRARNWAVRLTLKNRHRQPGLSGPKSADIVAKVENRATRKISRKLIFGLLCRCVAFQRHYGGPRSILDEAIWSLTSP